MYFEFSKSYSATLSSNDVSAIKRGRGVAGVKLDHVELYLNKPIVPSIFKNRVGVRWRIYWAACKGQT